jgi:hypothetical protein
MHPVHYGCIVFANYGWLAMEDAATARIVGVCLVGLYVLVQTLQVWAF